MKKPFPLSKVYQLLEPGPVVLVTTSHRGLPNVMTMSWHTMMDFEPPLVGCVLSEGNYSYEAFTKSQECVINIPTVELAKKVVSCGNTTGQKINKIKRFKLAVSPAAIVEAPLLDECYASLECRVIDTDMAKRYNFFVLEIVKAWVDPSVKNPKTLPTTAAMGLLPSAGKIIKLRSQKK